MLVFQVRLLDVEETHTNWYFATLWLSFQCPFNAIPCFRANIDYTFVETVVNPQGATKSVQQDRRKAATRTNIELACGILSILVLTMLPLSLQDCNRLCALANAHAVLCFGQIALQRLILQSLALWSTR